MVMNKGLIPYKRGFLYVEGIDVYSYKARSREVWSIIQRNGSWNASYEDEGERERRKGRKQSYQPPRENRNYIKVHYTVLKMKGDGMMHSGI